MKESFFEFHFVTPKTGYKTKLNNYHDLNSWIRSGEIVNYFTRSDKCCVFNNEINNEEAILNVSLNDINSKREWYLNHLKSKVKSKQSGLYSLFDNRPFDLDLNFVKNKLTKLDQPVWECIINPGELGLDANVLTKDRWHNLLQKHFGDFLKASKFELTNVNAYYAIHGNTEHPHVHMMFFEKIPAKKQGKIDYINIDNLKRKLTNELNNDAFGTKLFDFISQVWDARKTILEHISSEIGFKNSDIKNYKEFVLASQFVLVELSKKKDVSYKRLSDASKFKINHIKQFLEVVDPNFKQINQNYEDKIWQLKQLALENHTLARRINQIIQKERSDFELQVGNKIVKSLLLSNKKVTNFKTNTSKNWLRMFTSTFLNSFYVRDNSHKLLREAYIAFHLKDLDAYEQYKGTKIK